jgi:hypothetical protein
MRKAHNKLTQEQVIISFKEVHGDAFDYSKVVYVDINTPVEVYCKKHDFTFNPTPKNHKNGSKCKHCGREAQIEKAKKDINKFKQEMFDLYGDQYDFTNSNYVNTKTELTIICKTHGEFSKAPFSLLNGSACDKCAKNAKSNNKLVFIEEARKVYGDKDDYTDTEVISSVEKIEVRCTKHNYTFTKSIQTYLSGYGCPKCSAENYRKLRALPSEEYYKRVNEKHENAYTYLGDYTTLSGVVTFFCEEHGKQRLNANSHLIGAGCKKCNRTPIKINKRTKEGYCKLANGRPTKLYFLECFKDCERFYKVGKTFKEIHERYHKSKMYYDYEIKHIYTASAEEIWDLEESFHLEYKEFRHHPKNWFAGYSESYRMSLPIEEIIKNYE